MVGSDTTVTSHVLRLSVTMEKMFKQVMGTDKRTDKLEEDFKASVEESKDQWEWLQQALIHITDAILELMENSRATDALVRYEVCYSEFIQPVLSNDGPLG